jgi:drug/metabolite transporter (DMT)-like permease
MPSPAPEPLSPRPLTVWLVNPFDDVPGEGAPPLRIWTLARGLAAGALNSFGVIAAFAAYRYDGKAAIVTTLAAAIQPLVTIVLALIFLGEKVGLIESAGIAVAIRAAVTLSQETKNPA